MQTETEAEAGEEKKEEAGEEEESEQEEEEEADEEDEEVVKQGENVTTEELRAGDAGEEMTQRTQSETKVQQAEKKRQRVVVGAAALKKTKTKAGKAADMRQRKPRHDWTPEERQLVREVVAQPQLELVKRKYAALKKTKSNMAKKEKSAAIGAAIEAACKKESRSFTKSASVRLPQACLLVCGRSLTVERGLCRKS